jgi:hypothetical protein
MEQNIVIYIGIWKALGLIATVVLGTWYAAYRLGKVETKVEGFDERIKTLEGRLDNAFAGRSPLALLEKGRLILNESGLKEYIDNNKTELFEQCQKNSGMGNPYDIQEAAFKFFDQVTLPAGLENKLKTAAYKHGVTMETVRRVGGIYFRDICLDRSGYKPEDLDKPTLAA